jgi:acetyltransferase-like isoleucine patch superfamily enzyme
MALTSRLNSLPFDDITIRPIVIEPDVWIGAGATVTPGVTIGYGAVIGARTVVAKDVPPLTVVTGTSLVVRQQVLKRPGRRHRAAARPS